MPLGTRGRRRRTAAGVTSPYLLDSLTGATAIDVEVQATNAAASPSGWSGITTGKTWGATVVPGAWTAASKQVHGTSVAPNGGVMMTVVAAPTVATGANFPSSLGNSTLPTAGLIATSSDGQPNGWAQYCHAPATASTYDLWMIVSRSPPRRIACSVPRRRLAHARRKSRSLRNTRPGIRTHDHHRVVIGRTVLLLRHHHGFYAFAIQPGSGETRGTEFGRFKQPGG